MWQKDSITLSFRQIILFIPVILIHAEIFWNAIFLRQVKLTEPSLEIVCLA